MAKTTPTMAALDRAIEAAGGQSKLARRLRERTNSKVRQGHIWAWRHRTGVVPAEYVLPLEDLTGVSRHDVRPDLYPRETGT
jgi:DNA-binding transcriptional regulator YdaS (Cro superfamily)